MKYKKGDRVVALFLKSPKDRQEYYGIVYNIDDIKNEFLIDWYRRKDESYVDSSRNSERDLEFEATYMRNEKLEQLLGID